MATFFFDFVDGPYATRDCEGHECEGAEAARIEALRVLPEVCSDAFRDVDARQISCSVRDQAGTIVYRAILTLHGQALPNR